LYELHYMGAYVIKNNGSSNNLPCYPPDSHHSHNAVYCNANVAVYVTAGVRDEEEETQELRTKVISATTDWRDQ